MSSRGKIFKYFNRQKLKMINLSGNKVILMLLNHQAQEKNLIPLILESENYLLKHVKKIEGTKSPCSWRCQRLSAGRKTDRLKYIGRCFDESFVVVNDCGGKQHLKVQIRKKSIFQTR